jgi:hypothetical protein
MSDIILGVLLLAFPVGLALAAIFGRKYENLTDEEKKIYHRIEKEKGKEYRPPHMSKSRIFRNILIFYSFVIAVGCICLFVFELRLAYACIITFGVVIFAGCLYFKNDIKGPFPKQTRSPHPIVRMLQSDDDMYED